MKLFIFLLLAIAYPTQGFEKIVIWGHKLHSHTHSYIHNGFYRACKAMGYDTYWFDDKDDVSDFDFSGSLFITEGQADHKIPLRFDCDYMLHNCTSPKYKSLPQENRIVFQVYNRTIHDIPYLTQVEPCIYYDLPGRCLYMPWATDLLPEEIETNKALNFVSEKKIYWVGTIGSGLFGNIEEIAPFKKACAENNIEFVKLASVSVEENVKYIQRSYIAPTIVGTWQLGADYIPCRIFKNISYGKMGVTNSHTVNDLFEGKLVYNPDTYQLFFDAEERMKTMSVAELHELMDMVKNRHTYFNRVNTMLDFLALVKKMHRD